MQELLHMQVVSQTSVCKHPFFLLYKYTPFWETHTQTHRHTHPHTHTYTHDFCPVGAGPVSAVLAGVWCECVCVSKTERTGGPSREVSQDARWGRSRARQRNGGIGAMPPSTSTHTQTQTQTVLRWWCVCVCGGGSAPASPMYPGAESYKVMD